MPAATQKDGASIAPAPVPTSAGSHSASDPVRAKIRALLDVLGNQICRFPDGQSVQVTSHALKIITPVHGA